MTKLFPILLIACLMACSKDDKKEDSQTHMNPPEWIQGIWECDMSTDYSEVLFRWTFTENNITQYHNMSGMISNLNFAEGYSQGYSVNEVEKTNAKYEFTLAYPGGTTSGIGYTFKKIDDNTMKDATSAIYKRK